MPASPRPLSITIVAWLFVAVGVVGLASAARPLFREAAAGRLAELSRHELVDFVLAAISGLVALLGGALLRSGRSAGRWMVVGWMIFHLGVSAAHSLGMLLLHCALFAAPLWFLFRPRAAAYLSSRGTA